VERRPTGEEKRWGELENMADGGYGKPPYGGGKKDGANWQIVSIQTWLGITT
jgi:hypothetical protein